MNAFTIIKFIMFYYTFDELGTRAGAAIEVGIAEGVSDKTLLLNRLFIYAIVDNKTGLL